MTVTKEFNLSTSNVESNTSPIKKESKNNSPQGMKIKASDADEEGRPSQRRTVVFEKAEKVPSARNVRSPLNNLDEDY